MTELLSRARAATPTQRRIALALLVGLLLLVPALPVAVAVVLTTATVWAAAQPLLVGMGLGAYVLHRRRKAVAR
ncbi:hypothetical protein [Streptomyces sp. NPDC088910]|uniref:hypothetical protein n=1 Tax=unclassified Streptomyces TaxID=2593676 RepID=UPI00382A6A61